MLKVVVGEMSDVGEVALIYKFGCSEVELGLPLCYDDGPFQA